MKKLFTLLLVATFICTFSHATIRRVGYAGIQLAGVDYSSFQTAQDNSAAGDTIQIYGNASGTVNKRLVVLGFGYNFSAHPSLNAVDTDNPSNISLTFANGSDGTIATGLSGTFTIIEQSGQHNTINNITFQRCYGAFNLYNNSAYGLISNVKIISSVITGGGMIWAAEADYPVNNLQVFNCIITSFNLYKTGTTASFINCAVPSPDIIGNYYLGLNDASVLVRNCIIPAAGTTANINTVYESNFFREAQPAQLPAGSNNRWAQDWAVLFARISTANNNASYHGYADFDENYYILRTGSPAINGGVNGAGQPTNCGIFGGEPLFVYRPSGIPAVPSIYKLTASTLSATANPYNVTISVKSNN